MKIAFLYAGQGSQYVGMGQEFYDSYVQFREIFNQNSLEFNLKEICFEDKNGLLDKTQYTQPCITAYQVALTNVIFQHGIRPEYTVGVSLGEYSALYAAGVWNANEVLEIVSYRGKVMEECVRGKVCLTASIIGLSNQCVEDICKKCSQIGVVQVTNYCCSGNVSVGGEKKAVEAVMNKAQKAGAKYCILQRSCYPFHTTLLEDAGEKIYERLQETKMREMGSTVVFNYVGRAKKNDETIAELLKAQTYNCIYLEKSIRFLEREGVDTMIDLGPGNTIGRIVKRIVPGVKVYSISNPSDIENLALEI